MPNALIDNYSKEELEEIVKNSKSMRDVIKKIGYSTVSGSNNDTVKNRLIKYNIDYSHFSTVNGAIIRNEENIFIKDSTASQKTLRDWYKKGEYTPYICSICGIEPIWQGKELTLILDHINGENHDDRLENLRWVCPNCNQQLPTTGFRGKKYNIEEKEENLIIKNYCIDCGKEISRGATRCKECQLRKVSIPLDQMPVTREELKNLIKTTPFTTIGEQFGVSDNAIRKWCIKFNLPTKSREIKKYSNEEWELI